MSIHWERGHRFSIEIRRAAEAPKGKGGSVWRRCAGCGERWQIYSDGESAKARKYYCPYCTLKRKRRR